MLEILPPILFAFFFPTWAFIGMYLDPQTYSDKMRQATVLFVLCLLSIFWMLVCADGYIEANYDIGWLTITPIPRPPFPI